MLPRMEAVLVSVAGGARYLLVLLVLSGRVCIVAGALPMVSLLSSPLTARGQIVYLPLSGV